MCAQPASWDMLMRAMAASSGGSAGLYLACGAAGALLQHLLAGAHVLAHSLSVCLAGTSAHMLVDAGKQRCKQWHPLCAFSLVHDLVTVCTHMCGLSQGDYHPCVCMRISSVVPQEPVEAPHVKECT